MTRITAFLIGLLLCVPAWAQVGSPSVCGPTSVGNSSAVAVSYPNSGSTGNATPNTYVTISNPSATATLWVNVSGGTAAANAAGSQEIAAGATYTWGWPTQPPPRTISVIASAGSTPVTCYYQ